jgi:hypothetical protein
MGNKMISDSLINICCPCCEVGYMKRGNDATSFRCELCGEVLRCLYCGASRNLRPIISGNTKFIECRVCREKFWDKIYEAVPKSNSRNIKKKTKSKMGLVKKSKINCPRCTSEKVDVNSDKEYYLCESCNLKFNDKRSISRPKLITDPQKIGVYSKNLFSECPNCKSTNIFPSLSEIQCKDCGCKWHPCPDENDKSPHFLDDCFWEAKCPKCNKKHSKTIRKSSGDLKCLICGEEWKPLSQRDKERVLEDDDDDGDDENRYDQSYIFGDYDDLNIDENTDIRHYVTRTLCPVCSNGYIENGRCLRCGAKMARCEVCSEPFNDTSQKSGRCDKCKSNDNKSNEEDNILVCDLCKNVDSLKDADLYHKCSCCETVKSIDSSQLLNEITKRLNKKKKSPPRYDFNEEEFCRYLEYKDQLADLVDRLMESTQKVQDLVFEGLACAEEFNELENLVQQITDVQIYVNSGDGLNDNDDDDDDTELWSGDSDDRWKDFDSEVQNYSKSFRNGYYDVSVTEVNSGDLLEDEDFHFYKNKKNVCRHCGRSPILYDGLCEKCFCPI